MGAAAASLSGALPVPTNVNFYDKVTVQADPANAGNIAVGDAPSLTAGSGDGVILQAGQIKEYEYLSVNDLKLVVSNTGDSVIVGIATVKTS